MIVGFQMKYRVEPSYLTAPSKRRSGIKMPKVLFVVSHDTGNDGSTARGNVNYYQNSRNDMSASAHIFVDDRQIIECIPALTGAPEKAWHVLYGKTKDNELYGDDANDVAIGVELCYSSSKGSINNEESYKRYVWVLAYICYKFKLDPSKDITGHHILDPGRKTDPENALRKMGKSFSQLIKDVVEEYKECSATESKVDTTKGIGIVEVLVDNLNLRSSSNPNSPVIGQASSGDKYYVYATENGMHDIGGGFFVTTLSQYVKFKSHPKKPTPKPKPVEKPVEKVESVVVEKEYKGGRPLILADHQFKALEDALKELRDKGILDSEQWEEKVRNKDLTVDEAIFLSIVISNRLAK